MSDKKLFLLDGHALIYRAHYAFIKRPLVNSKGLNVSAIDGFTRTLWSILTKEKPSHIAVAFDLPGGTFRNEMYPEYKANREEQPDDITTAIPYIQQIIEAMNIPVAASKGFEADDVIGTLAKQAEKEGFEVYMMTPDKDYAQLVSDKVYMYKPARFGNGIEILDAAKVCEKWDIERVEQVIDILGLQGDSVDNIPGIPGIGAKTAVKLLKQFGSMENLLENTDQLKGKQKENVEKFAEQGLLSKQLATIKLDVPIQFDAEKYIVEDINREALTELFRELEFRSLSKSILGSSDSKGNQHTDNKTAQTDLFGNPVASKGKKTVSAPEFSIAKNNIENVKHDYHLIDTPELRADLVKKLSKQKVLCFDTETTSIDANQAELVGIAFSYKKNEAYYVPVPDNEADAKAIMAEFKPILEDENIEKVGQNLKYDIIVLKWYDVEVKGRFYDTMLAHYLIEPEKRHNMNYLAESYLAYAPVSIESLIGKKGKNQLTMRDVPVAQVSEYAGEDADITLQLKEILHPKVKEEKLDRLLNNVEIPLINVLAAMEFEGIRVDADFLNDYSKTLTKEIEDLKKKVFDEAGTVFNLDSPKQVGEVLFDKLKIPYRWRKTKTGQYSTNEEKLSELAKDHEIINNILQHRSYAKLRSTYVDALPRMINPKTGRVHSSFNQALASTGRLSSNNPNLQNIPIRTEAGRQIRKAFIPRDENHTLLAADYSQIELRLIAEISGDEAMLEAFSKGQDIHRATAARVYGVPFDEVSADQRRNAKTVNFSIIYGAGATNLSRQLDIKRTEAAELIEQYFKQYEGLKIYMDKVVAEARENGYVTTLLGRKRSLRDINSKSSLARSQAERNAINTPIQGTAADMIKVAMIDIHEALRTGEFATKMILQVHDELVFDVPKSELDTIKPIIEEKMKNAIPNLKVPIVVGMDTGGNWLEAH